MRYFATIGGRERTVDLEALGGSKFRVSVDGGPVRDVDAERVEGMVVNLLVAGASYDVDLEEDGESLNVLVTDELFRFDMLDERRRRLKLAKGPLSVTGPQVIASPMPGKIVKILAPAGTAVVEGQGVVVVEAMKMENELRALKAGVVREVFVVEGQTVESKAKLVTID